MEIKEERLLSTHEVARLLNLHPNTVRNMLQDGRLQAIKTRGRTGQYRFRETDILSYLEAEGTPQLFERKEKDVPLQSIQGAVRALKKQPNQVLQESLEYLGECGNPFRVLGSYLEATTPEQYSKHLTGKAAIWVEETLRQAEHRFDQSHLAVFYPGTKEDFLRDIGVGVAAKKGSKGDWLLTSLLVYPREKPAYLLDGTLQQFHPEMKKGAALLRWEERDRYYTGLEIVSSSEFKAAVLDRNATYFQAFLLKVRRDNPF